jgi:hypothetical protein
MLPRAGLGSRNTSPDRRVIPSARWGIGHGTTADTIHSQDAQPQR